MFKNTAKVLMNRLTYDIIGISICTFIKLNDEHLIYEFASLRITLLDEQSIDFTNLLTHI